MRMSKLTDINYIKSILSKHGFTFSKSLGQNFLVNPSVCPKMADLCGADDRTGVIEIGPGAGVLTNELALRSCKVVAVELDKRLLPVLEETLSGHKNVRVINDDSDLRYAGARSDVSGYVQNNPDCGNHKDRYACRDKVQ